MITKAATPLIKMMTTDITPATTGAVSPVWYMHTLCEQLTVTDTHNYIASTVITVTV